MTVSRACWRVNNVFTYFLDYSVYLANNFSRQILAAWLVVIYQCPNREIKWGIMFILRGGIIISLKRLITNVIKWKYVLQNYSNKALIIKFQLPCCFLLFCDGWIYFSRFSTSIPSENVRKRLVFWSFQKL